MSERPEATDRDDPPPILGSWRNVYLLVLVELAVIVAALALLRAWAA